MHNYIAHVAIVVQDYDEAIAFYTQKLGFELIEDTPLTAEKRWVLVRPKYTKGTALLLAKASNDNQKKYIGNQAGGRVFLFLYTDNFDIFYQNLLKNNIKIIRQPKDENYGKVAVFEDLYGNFWDLIESKSYKKMFYTNAILQINENVPIEVALEALKNLREATLLELGCLSFEIHQMKDNPRKMVVMECFDDESHFHQHLNSLHLQNFLAQNIVSIEKTYETQNIM